MKQQFNGIIKGPPARLDGYTICLDSLEWMVKQRKALIGDDWENLETLANQGIGKAYGAYREMIRSLGVRHHLNLEAKQNLATILISHASKKSSRKEFFSELKKQLVKIEPDTPPNRLAALDKLVAGKISENLLIESLKHRQSEDLLMVANSIEATVALASKSLVALTYTNFQTHYKQLSKYPFEVHDETLLESMEKLVDGFDSSLEAGIKQVYESIRKGDAPITVAETLAGSIENHLPELGRIQATIRHYLNRVRAAADSLKLLTAAEKLSVTAADSTRCAFAAHAAAYFLALQCKAVQKEVKAKAVLEPSAGLRFDTNFPTGKTTRLSQIGTVANGAYIKLSGFVQTLSARKDRDRKLISYFTLCEPGEDATADGVGVFVHLRHVGMQEGAYCSVTGTWKKKSTLHKGNPALEVEKLRISELSGKSWKVLFLDLADKFVDRWPGSLNLAYGLSPHVSGGKKGKSKILGAGELIFKPFIR